MAFVTDKEELKPGLIIFRRGDVDHRNWYCRVKLPKADRYKTVSLKTADLQTARHLAWEQEVEVRALLKRGVPVFNRPFSQVGEEYLNRNAKDEDGKAILDKAANKSARMPHVLAWLRAHTAKVR